MWNALVTSIHLVVAILLLFLGGEIGSRLDDWIKYGTPVFNEPNLESELKISDSNGVRGKPFGKFQAVSLNGQGFRGPALLAKGEVPRVIVLGASEAFGSTTTKKDEFPSVLRGMLPSKEVVNTSIIGMTAGSMADYWSKHVVALAPADVIVICNPYFYLRKDALETAVSVPGIPSAPPRVQNVATFKMQSRFLPRLKNQIFVPDIVNDFRQSWKSNEVLSRQKIVVSDDFPEDCLDRYISDVEKLVRQISESCRGEVFVLTYPIAASTDNIDRAKSYLLNFRNIRPGFTDAAITRYGEEANRRLRETAWHEGVQLLDIATLLSGKTELFRDLVHYNENGSRAVAEGIAIKLQ